MVLSTALSKSDILEAIWDTVPVGAPDPTDPQILAKLSALTQQLIDVTGRKRLSFDPFAEVYERRVVINRDKVKSILKNKVVLVTGGQGFVGTNLIAKLQQFGVKKIVSVDLTDDRSQRVAIDTTKSNFDIPVSYHDGDVRDLQGLQAIFDSERPQVVFHLAAERLPGLAETRIHQTVSTNILGCDHILQLCEQNQVEACIFSSTGKASRYFTPDIYAASKKIAEWLFSDNSKPRQCKYGIVRFTHVIENSPVGSDMDERVAKGLVSMHAPDRHIYTQNVEEAVGLLLNALTILKPGQTKLLAVKDIGWPINTLDLALHKIVMSGRNDIPIYFKGIPAGYERHVFMGQLDLSGEREILPMLNVLESGYAQISKAGDTVMSAITPFDPTVLDRCMADIRAAVGSIDTDIKKTVIDSLKQIVLSSFYLADPFKLLDILGWGVNSNEMAAAGVDITYYQETVELLVRGVGIAPSQVAVTETVTETETESEVEAVTVELHSLETVTISPVREVESTIKLPVRRAKKPKQNGKGVAIAS
jgi:NADP-dependent 3-hydroxy acid dehydrogenase YdfG